jgi:hypothetical protein
MSDGCSWEQGIVVAEEQFGFEKLNPYVDGALPARSCSLF